MRHDGERGGRGMVADNRAVSSMLTAFPCAAFISYRYRRVPDGADRDGARRRALRRRAWTRPAGVAACAVRHVSYFQYDSQCFCFV
jgi:hypothetical protein